MKNRIVALLCLCVLVLNLVGSTAGYAKFAPPQTSTLVQFLPAVDGVVLIDSKRFFSTTLPKLLSANPTLLGKITSGIEELRTNSGVDIRRFEQMAVGFNAKPKGAKDLDADAVVIARGPVNPAALIGAAKLAQEAGGSLFGLRDGYISVVG